MNFALSDEQEFLKEAARDALSRFKTVEAAREALDGGELPDLWPTAVEAGWPGLLVSEANGGAELSPLEAMLVFEELGRVLASVPLLGHLPASFLLDRGGAAEAAAACAAGDARAAFVPARPPGDVDARWTVEPAAGLERAAAPTLDGDGLVTGAVHWVPDPLNGKRRRAAEWRDPDHDGRELPISVSVPIGEGPTGFGSFEFWQRRRLPLDPNLSDALDSISELVAEVLERRRAEAETEKLKNEFFALVSHELRTPLTSIIGYLELILEEESGEVADEQRQFLTVIERNARRLLRLVGDLLFVAQVEAGTLSLERHGVDLESVVRDAVEAARPRAEQAGVELVAHTEPVPALDGDGDRLAQVVDNLITNAVKFTPAGGRVTVRSGRREGSVFVEVTDTGVGIAADEQDRLFERFFRTKAATEASVQGIGLGLSIVRAIAHGHGGEVACVSEEGVGTTFTVELPIPIHEVTRR